MTRPDGGPRVVVTGCGVCSHYGYSGEALGRSGEGAEEREGVLSVGDAGLSEELAKWVTPMESRRLNRLTKFGVLAALSCVKGSGLVVEGEGRDLVGAIFSSTFGPVASTRDFIKTGMAQGHHSASPLIFPYTVGNAAGGVITVLLGWRGVNSTVSGYNPICYGFDVLQDESARALLVGGIEELTPEMIDAFGRRTLSGGGALDAVRPLSEGAAMLLMETWQSARDRGARVLFEVCGCGTSTNLAGARAGVDNMGEIEPGAIASAMRQALSDASVGVEEVGAVVSLARQDSRQIDSERIGLDQVFGEAMHPAVVHPKAVLGETFGASETFSAIYWFYHRGSRETANPEKPYVIVNGYQLGGSVSTVVLRRLGDEEAVAA